MDPNGNDKNTSAGKLVKQARSALESRITTISDQDNVLQQSRFWMKTVTWSLIGTTVIGIGWLAIARTEEVVVATGKLEPVGNVKDVRIPPGGVVEAILVKNGQRVSKGEALIRLDQESSAEQLKSLTNGVNEKTTQISQKQQQLLLKKQERERTLDLNREQLASTRVNLGLEQEILNRLAGLAKDGAVPDIQYLQQRNKVQELKGELTKREIDGRRQINQVDQQIEQLNAELAGLRSERAQLNANLTEVRVTNKNQTLRAPVDGIVFDLKINNPGFISQSMSSEVMLKVVPFNTLEADVMIPSNKIGFVRAGQPADISIDSFPASDFGVLEGTVESVGSDALPPNPQQMRQEYTYPAVIKLDSQQLKLKSGKQLPLQVGMSLTANIKLRSVSYLQLLLNTFQSKTDSLRQL
ncbi:HlyD family secretion protein [Synechococcus sp. MIT S9508]|uniref:HlyD family secretion protein n=1 Tax=Synechococcus sp. MIT S9508 TaxID=1801629 RepID=UPI0007BC64DD|nr:HlyD family efflux transporter periplasmic adaptor subunit [Synechococcus sp. MIT S9508]KZR90332.1 Hemolysin secretion protein D, plasmid [Synechococcus sp. MIT S9508]